MFYPVVAAILGAGTSIAILSFIIAIITHHKMEKKLRKNVDIVGELE